MDARIRAVPIAVIALLGLWVPACGGASQATPGADSTAAAPSQTQARGSGTLGTLHATVDGVERTWYVVSGPIQGREQATGGWLMVGGRQAIAISGFDVEDPPFESFEWDAQGMLTGYGSYTGSVISVMVEVDSTSPSQTIRFPAEPGKFHAMTWLPRATTSDLSLMYLMAEGTIGVTRAAISAEGAILEGTFAGTFRSIDASSSISITGGRFETRLLGPLAQP